MQPSRPLGGLRVLDFSRFVAGPQATRILSWFGAEIIKIEWPEYPGLDWMRHIGPFHGGVDTGNTAANFNNINTGKLSITLDLRLREGQELVRRLINISDVVLEAYSPTVMARQGLDYENARKIRPDIIYIAQSGFGHTGPYKEYRSWGPTAQAFSGLTRTSGLPDRQPAGWGYSYMDHTGGYLIATSLMTALHHRRRTGKGQFIDASQVQAACTLNGAYVLDYTVNGRPFARPGMPPGNRATHPAVAPHNSYRCAGEDRWCVISVFDEPQWEALKRCLGSPRWAEDPKFATVTGRLANEDELDRHIEAWTAERDRYDIMRELQAAGVPAGAVQFPDDRVDNDEHLRARGVHVEIQHTEYGPGRYEGSPVKLSRTPPLLDRAAPCIGEHNVYAYGELLAMEPSEIAALESSRVLRP